jgi:hypothetical protein
MTSPLVTFDIIAAKQSVTRKSGSPYLADIGNDDGQIYVKNNKGYIYVREVESVSATGATTYGKAYQVRSQKSHLVGRGIRVRVVYDTVDDEWEIDRTDFQTLVDQGINPAIENHSNPYTKIFDMESLPLLLSYAVSSAATETTEVDIKNLLYLDYIGDVKAFKLATDSRPDISDHEPAAGFKRLVHLWLNHDNTVSMTVSTPILETLEFTIATDLAECMENPPNNLSLPIGAWQIKNGQTAITPAEKWMDTRQWINQPVTPALPDPITKNYIIPVGTQMTYSNAATITTGTLTIDGTLYVRGDRPLPGYTTVVEIDNTDSPYSPDDEEVIIADSSAGNITISLPAIASNQSKVYSVKNIGTGTVTLDGNASETIDGATTLDIIIQYDAPKIVATSTEWSVI